MNKSDVMFDAWLMHTKPVMPVIVNNHESDALPLADALMKGGVRLFEVTLRTASALHAIELMSRELPDLITGAGTVIRPEQVDDVANAGGRFIVSPGFSETIAKRAEAHGLAYLPGVATATEIMMALNCGYQFLKFYPAAQAGGINMIKAFSGPFPQVTFCPTGGISEQDYGDYLKLNNVRCVGGSWFVSSQLVRDKKWATITSLAEELPVTKSAK